jgi:hypothetical protein
MLPVNAKSHLGMVAKFLPKKYDLKDFSWRKWPEFARFRKK